MHSVKFGAYTTLWTKDHVGRSPSDILFINAIIMSSHMTLFTLHCEAQRSLLQLWITLATGRMRNQL
jgi:hypothetical protein